MRKIKFGIMLFIIIVCISFYKNTIVTYDNNSMLNTIKNNLETIIDPIDMEDIKASVVEVNRYPLALAYYNMC